LRAYVAGVLADGARYRPLRETAVAVRVSGEEVRRARLLAGLSQRELAERLSCPRSTIADAERERRAGGGPAGVRIARWVRATLAQAGSPVGEGDAA
jgi:predicted transcriptional regulator